MSLFLIILVGLIFVGLYLWYGINLYTRVWWAYGEQSPVKATLTCTGIVLGWPLIFLWCLTK